MKALILGMVFAAILFGCPQQAVNPPPDAKDGAPVVVVTDGGVPDVYGCQAACTADQTAGCPEGANGPKCIALCIKANATNFTGGAGPTVTGCVAKQTTKAGIQSCPGNTFFTCQ